MNSREWAGLKVWNFITSRVNVRSSHRASRGARERCSGPPHCTED